VISRIKIISNLDITNRKLPQDGSAHMKFDHREIDLRISTLPSIYGEKVVIRVLDRTVGLIPLTSLGIPDAILKKLIETFNQSQGMLLVTGPTGSGKTTTLYACINQLRSEAENIVTVEYPVEYKLEGITQVSVNEAIGYGFSTALRSILRQDPDIILVGEIRDVETAEIAIRSALTGHLVLSTLHTNDTIATITRLIDIGVPEFLVSSSVTGILAQRLVRKTCEFCKTEIEPRLDMYNAPFPSLQRAYKGKGCARCFYTGYYGQTGVYEFLKLTTKLKRMVARKAPESELREAAEEEGFNSLFRDAWAKVQEGLTTIEEVLGKIPFPSGHEYAVKTEDEKTIDELVESYKKDPANVSIIERLADMYKKAGNFGEAAGMYLQMLEFDNTRSDTHYGLGKIYLEMGMIDKAIEHIKRAWGLSPSSQEITDCLKELSKSYRITI
jgi:type IV pilus assembly protein PilB